MTSMLLIYLFFYCSLRPWSSWTANSDKKYMELNGAALNGNKPCVTFWKTAFPEETYRWVVLQKLPQLSDTHFSQVLHKLEKKFFHGFIKYHLALISSKLYKFPPPQTTTA